MIHPLALASLLFATGAAAQTPHSFDWRQDARPDDAARIARLDEAWAEALAEAGRKNPGELKSLGALADPEAELDRPHLPPGDYRCRTVKLGSGSGGAGPGMTAYDWFRCQVELSPGGDLTLRKVTGSQRPMGNLYPEAARRLVYLGAVAWGDEAPAAYGRDPERDQAGVLQRIGPRRWRLALPYPRQESTLDLIELRR